MVLLGRLETATFPKGGAFALAFAFPLAAALAPSFLEGNSGAEAPCRGGFRFGEGEVVPPLQVPLPTSGLDLNLGFDSAMFKLACLICGRPFGLGEPECTLGVGLSLGNDTGVAPTGVTETEGGFGELRGEGRVGGLEKPTEALRMGVESLFGGSFLGSEGSVRVGADESKDADKLGELGAE